MTKPWIPGRFELPQASRLKAPALALAANVPCGIWTVCVGRHPVQFDGLASCRVVSREHRGGRQSRGVLSAGASFAPVGCAAVPKSGELSGR